MWGRLGIGMGLCGDGDSGMRGRLGWIQSFRGWMGWEQKFVPVQVSSCRQIKSKNVHVSVCVIHYCFAVMFTSACGVKPGTHWQQS